MGKEGEARKRHVKGGEKGSECLASLMGEQMIQVM